MSLTIIVNQSLSLVSAQKILGSQPSPPKTRTDNVTEKINGVTITDPYRWLEDQNSPETRAWIDAQNKYTQSIIGALAGRDRISHRLEELLKVDVISTPTVRGGHYFFSKRRADQNQFVLYVRENGKDEVLVDPNAMNKDQTTSVSLADVSEDGKLLFYNIREGGADETTGVLLDVDQE